MKTAKFWHKTDKNLVHCDLCPHGCTIAEGKTGLCRVRSVRDGELKAIGYGLLSSVAMDPIEKKPLYHFHPGSGILSVGGWGCNFACVFCQNWTISQQIAERSQAYSPEDIVAQASAYAGDTSTDSARHGGSSPVARLPRGSVGASIGIAYTYNEPLINLEFVQECAIQARASGLVNVLVTNGYIQPEPAAELLNVIDGLNIDIKSMDDAFYRKQCHGNLGPVLAFARQARDSGCHVEVTNLLIPTLNDSRELLEKLAGWVRENLGETTPLHLSAYRPQYKLNIPSTSSAVLERAYEICKQELLYVYLGNVLTETGQDTLCPQCGSVIISRRGYMTKVQGLAGGTCRKCGRQTDIIGH